jgi:hypothetical protein
MDGDPTELALTMLKSEDPPKPSRKQVGMVLHALADHTAIMEMVQFDRLDHHGSNAGKETKYWPTETSIGRWFHAVGDDLEGRFQ